MKSTISTITSVPDNQYMTRHTINIGNEYRVLGYNPEMADLDNPRGELIDVIFFLISTDTDGNRRVYGCYYSEDAAELAIEMATRREPSRRSIVEEYMD